MTDYALSTNLYSYAQISQGYFGWPSDSGEAETIRKLKPGDLIVPKFAKNPDWSGADPATQVAYIEAIGLDPETVRSEYETEIAGGEAAVPFVLRVSEHLDDQLVNGVMWVRVAVEKVPLEHPLSSSEFLRAAALPVEVAAQFKGMVSPGRRLQEVPDGTAQAFLTIGATGDRGNALREYTIVEASTPEDAVQKLKSAGRLQAGGRVFVAAPGGMPGVHDITPAGELQSVGQEIAKTPDELLELFEQAALRATEKDSFSPQRALHAAQQLKNLMEGPLDVEAVDDFPRFHDRYNLLASKVNQALSLAKRPYAPHADDGDKTGTRDEDEEETNDEGEDLEKLQGLDVAAVRAELPDYMVLPDSVLQEAVTALRAGKHLLLSGPPGTGKSTVAEALCRAVVSANYDVATGTADWTTFDTIGGYMPTDQGLVFEPGVVLRCLHKGAWLVIDELNRADIDKAFGPLFTLLAGTGDAQPNRGAVLPYQRDGKNVEIRWAPKRSGAGGDYVLTPTWRLIGTLNVSDKATLFQLSFAFLRRFAVVDVPLPDREGYTDFFRGACSASGLGGEDLEKVVTAAMDAAFSGRQLGPAILRDIAAFVVTGLTETATGQPTYDDPVATFVTAVRLFAVPQYEGATTSEITTFLNTVKAPWPDRPEESWEALDEALKAVALS